MRKRKPVGKRERLAAWLFFLCILILIVIFYSISGMGIGDAMGREMWQETSSTAPDDSTGSGESTEEQLRMPQLSRPKPGLFGR